MSYTVDNAVIMAAGLSSRFAPLSFERPKALINVKGEVLIERQIRQLREAGIRDIIVVVGYKKEAFQYLEEKMGVTLVENPDYETRNNNSTIKAAERFLGNSYICSSDNYFTENPFEREVEEAYYSAEYAEGKTKEWCLTTDEKDWITDVVVGGYNQWYMMGHAFWSKEFSDRFLHILNSVYERPETVALLWCAGVCVCVCVHTPVGTGAHTGVHVFRVCVCTDMHVCVHAQQQRALLIILCEVCTPGSVRGQEGTCTLRPRTEPPDPKGL